jgi:hypothetical protein
VQVCQREGFRGDIERAVEICSGANDEEREEEGGKEGRETQFEKRDEEFSGCEMDIRIRPVSRENLSPVSSHRKRGWYIPEMLSDPAIEIENESARNLQMNHPKSPILQNLHFDLGIRCKPPTTGQHDV